MSYDVKGKIKVGDAVWDERRPKPERNGTVTRVLYDDEEVIVKFTNTELPDSLTFDELENTWTDSLGGVWMIYA